MKVKRILSLILSVAMMAAVIPCGILPASAAAGIDTEDLTLFGRTYVKDKILYLFWTNSGFAFKFDGTGAKIDVTSTGTGRPAYLCVYVDGSFAPTKTIKLTSNTTLNAVLAENLPDGEHTIEVRKRNEANYGGSATVGIKALKVTGDILEPPAAPARKIEFIGDSITCGFGNMGGTDYDTDHQDGTMTYAALTAKELHADISVVARSGIGFCTGYGYHNNTSDCSIYPYYEKTAALPGDTRCGDAWDFENNKKDVVVIALGGNDNGCTATDAQLLEEARKLANMVREDNPDSLIVWISSVMGAGRSAVAAQQVVSERKDEKFLFFPVPQLVSTTEGVGAAGHPTVQTHINRSILLAEFIAEQMGWEADASVMLKAQMQLTAPAATEEALATCTAISAQRLTRAMEAGEALLQDPTATPAQQKAAADAIWKAQLALTGQEDVSDEYIVIEPYESLAGFLVGYGTRTLDTEDYRCGSGCVANTLSSGLLASNKTGAYDIPLPEDWRSWYIELWLYVDKPANIPAGSCLEISETVDVTEMSWSLPALGLFAGWNKLQLKIGTAALMGADNFTTIKNVRFFIINLTEPITVKLDHLVLSKGKTAKNIDEWSAAIEKAESLLACGEDAALSTALELAEAAASQADVDAFTARLQTAIAQTTIHYPHTFDDAWSYDAQYHWHACSCGAHDEDIAHVWDKGTVDRAATETRNGIKTYTCTVCGATRQTAITADDTELPDAPLDLTAPGDVDGSGTVDSTDARLILQYYAKKIGDTALDLSVADVDGSGTVDSTDARLMLQLYAKKIDKLPKA